MFPPVSFFFYLKWNVHYYWLHREEILDAVELQRQKFDIARGKDKATHMRDLLLLCIYCHLPPSRGKLLVKLTSTLRDVRHALMPMGITEINLIWSIITDTYMKSLYIYIQVWKFAHFGISRKRQTPNSSWLPTRDLMFSSVTHLTATLCTSKITRPKSMLDTTK